MEEPKVPGQGHSQDPRSTQGVNLKHTQEGLEIMSLGCCRQVTACNYLCLRITVFRRLAAHLLTLMSGVWHSSQRALRVRVPSKWLWVVCTPALQNPQP